MKRKPKISIEEQLYRAGIWERPMIAGYPKHKGIRIVSDDGTGCGTKIIDGETGKTIPYIYKAELSATAGGLWDCVLYGHKCAVDIKTGEYKLTRRK